MVDQELMTLLNNIVSLVGQAKEAVVGETPEGAEPEPGGENMDEVTKYLKALEAGGESEGDEDDEEKVEKSQESPSADEPGFADKTVDDQPETNEENISEVAKAIVKMLSKKSVKKSKPENETLKILKSLAARQAETETALTGILEGLGIAGEIKKAQEPKPTTKPVQSDIAEIRKSLELLAGTVKPQTTNAPVGQNDPHFLSKSLSGNDGAGLYEIFNRSK